MNPSSTKLRDPVYLPWPMVMDIADKLDAQGFTQLAREARGAVWNEAAKQYHAGTQGLAHEPPPPPVLVSSAFSLCVTHLAIDHDDGRAWKDCRFRQLFYFENPMDEHTLMWSDEIGAQSAASPSGANPDPAQRDIRPKSVDAS